MVKVLLVTTGDNAVRMALSEMKSIDLWVVDVYDCQSATQKSFLMDLRDILLKSGAHVLLTWRCPYIIPSDIFMVPEYGAFNLHPSLLPAYPGLNPWDAIYRNGETVTGVTLHKMSIQADAGEIVRQERFSIAGIPYEDARTISDMVASNMISDFIHNF